MRTSTGSSRISARPRTSLRSPNSDRLGLLRTGSARPDRLEGVHAVDGVRAAVWAAGSGTSGLPVRPASGDGGECVTGSEDPPVQAGRLRAAVGGPGGVAVGVRAEGSDGGGTHAEAGQVRRSGN